MVFCGACLIGTQAGISKRVLDYPSLRKLLGGADIQPALMLREVASLHGLHWQLRLSNVPPAEVMEIYREAIVPLLVEKNAYRNVLTRTVTEIPMPTPPAGPVVPERLSAGSKCPDAERDGGPADPAGWAG